MNPPTKTLIKEWLEKAEGDFEAALSLYRRKKKKKIYYIIAFHCQQTIEKYLKTLLLCHKISFPKTHDLIRLLNILKPKAPFLEGIKNELNLLNPFAVDFRYPGEDTSLEEVKEAVRTTKKLIKILQKRIKEFI